MFDFFELSVPLPEEHIEAPTSETIEVGYGLFEHQRQAAHEVQKKLYSGSRRVVLHMPTGAGKTRTAMNIIANHLRQHEPTIVVWLAYSEELCEQAAQEFQRAWSYLGNRDLHLYRFWGNRELDPAEIHDGFIVAGLSKLYSAAKQSIHFVSVLGSRCSLWTAEMDIPAVLRWLRTALTSVVGRGGIVGGGNVSCLLIMINVLRQTSVNSKALMAKTTFWRRFN